MTRELTREEKIQIVQVLEKARDERLRGKWFTARKEALEYLFDEGLVHIKPTANGNRFWKKLPKKGKEGRLIAWSKILDVEFPG